METFGRGDVTKRSTRQTLAHVALSRPTDGAAHLTTDEIWVENRRDELLKGRAGMDGKSINGCLSGLASS